MNAPSIFLLFITLALALPACKPKEGANQASAFSISGQINELISSKTLPATTASAHYDPTCEAWKTQAVREFPDLGVAGSRFNSLFLARAKQLQTQGAADLQNPAWPYLLAVQVNRELSAHPNPQIKTAAEPTPIQHVISLFTSLRDTLTRKLMDGPHFPSFTLPDSLGGGAPPQKTASQETEDTTEPMPGTTSVQTVKAAIGMSANPKICGIISSAERSVGGNPLEVTIILEKTITCKVDAHQFLSGNSEYYEIQNQGDSAVLINKSGSRSQITRKWSVGQKINIQGKLTQMPSGKTVLKDCILLD